MDLDSSFSGLDEDTYKIWKNFLHIKVKDLLFSSLAINHMADIEHRGEFVAIEWPERTAGCWMLLKDTKDPSNPSNLLCSY